jgi:hypothetical protein
LPTFRPLHEEVIMRRLFLIAGLMVCLVGPGAAEPFRNPFGVADVADPVSSEVRQLAERVSLQGDGADQNAEQWAPEATGHGGRGVDGAWYGRWEAGTAGAARIKIGGDRLFALYTDYNGRMAGKTWLIEAQILEKGRLVGSWVQVGDRSDTGPFVGLIVDDERIDGIWSWDGDRRWDFRRRLEQ